MTTLESIRQTGVIAILRAKDSEQLLAAAAAVRDGGVRAIEVTMTTPDALTVVNRAVASFGTEVSFGVGSVLDPETARAAILAGAQFVVCPTLNLRTIAVCRRYSRPVIPGAYSPTEILTAWEAGADLVKVFPADAGGPTYIAAIKAPLPQIGLVPTGGVNLDTAAAFVRAGADALGVGGALVSQKLLDTRDFATLTARARRFIEEVERGRSG